jgi:hypothetical protein
MIDRSEYFFLAVMPDQGVTAFRSDIDQKNLTVLKLDVQVFNLTLSVGVSE